MGARNVQEPKKKRAPKIGSRDLVQRLSSLMKAKEVSQSELASRLGTSRSYVSQLLRSNRNLTLATLRKLAIALKVKLNLLVGTDGSATLQEKAAAFLPEVSRGADRQLRKGRRPSLAPDDPSSTAPASVMNAATPRKTAHELIQQLPREVVEEIVKLVSDPPGPPGRRKGSGSKDDSLALNRIADLRVTRAAKSERKASRRVAAELGSANVESDARRFRRKYAANRPALEAAARKRLQAELAKQAAAAQRPGKPAGEKFDSRPSRTGATNSGRLPPLGELDFVVAALKDLQRQYKLAGEVYESLCRPYMLEQIAREAQLLTGARSPVIEAFKRHQERSEAQARAITAPLKVAEKLAAEAMFPPKHVLTSLEDSFGAKLQRELTAANRLWDVTCLPKLRHLDAMEDMRQQWKRIMHPVGSR